MKKRTDLKISISHYDTNTKVKVEEVENVEADVIPDTEIDPPEAHNQNADQITLQQYHIYGFKVLADYDRTNEHVAAVTQFITSYDALWRYLHSVQSICLNIIPAILASPAQSRSRALLIAVMELVNLFLEHLSSQKVSLFMIEIDRVLLVNVDAFRASDARVCMERMLKKVYGFQLIHCWIHIFMDQAPPSNADADYIALRNHFRACNLAMRAVFGC